MKEVFIKIMGSIDELINVKSLVTLFMTALLAFMMTGKFAPPQEFTALYCTSYGAIITFFFTKDNSK